MAKDYGQRPAVLLDIDPGEFAWLAHTIDTVTWMWGTFVDGKLQERDEIKGGKKKGQSKQRHTLGALLAEPADAPAARRRAFRGVARLMPPKAGEQA